MRDLNSIASTEELVFAMIEAYIHQHESKVYGLNQNVWRGTSPNISAVFENYLAIYIGNILGPRYQVVCDFPITLVLPNIPKYQEVTLQRTEGYPYVQRKPDIIVYDNENKHIKAIFDLKIDIGRTENWIQESKEKISIFEDALSLSFNGRDQKRTKIDLIYNKKLFYAFVMLNQGNGRSKQYQK